MAKNETEKEISKMVFDYEGTTYTMEFDRASAAQTEKIFDISINDVRDAKISSFQGLFYGAFLKHHPNIKSSTVDKFFELMPNKQDVYANLAIMYGECINSLLDEPEQGKAISWKAQ